MEKSFKQPLEVNRGSLVVSVDLHHVEDIEGATVLRGDITDPFILKQLSNIALEHLNASASTGKDISDSDIGSSKSISGELEGKKQDFDKGVFDVVLSDMAHPFTGSKSVDVPRVHQLVELALQVACMKGILKDGGNFVAKYLNGQGDQELKSYVSSHFDKLYTFKPKACRNSSTEAYFIALGFRRP